MHRPQQQSDSLGFNAAWSMAVGGIFSVLGVVAQVAA
jgi:hypothetical protein